MASDDWQVGDLAVSVPTPEIKDRWRTPGGPGYGTIVRVDGLVSVFGETGLVFNDHPSPHETRAWSHLGYRKIRADEQEACEPEFVTLLKRSRNRVTA